MKKHVKISLIVLCLLAMLFVVVFASCEDTEQPTEQITITVKLNLDGQEDKTFTVDKNAEFYSKLAEYVPQDIVGRTLVGWDDEDGASITADTRWDKDGSAIAVWAETNTITFNKNNPEATGEMAVMTVRNGETSKLAANAFTSSYEFGGWNTRADGLGEFYPDEHELNVTGNVTLYAQWKVSYTEEIWVEKFNGSDYVYVKEKTGAQEGFLGNNVSIKLKYDEPHYSLNETHPDSETDTPSLKQGDVLKAYYAKELITITYNHDGGGSDVVRYGDQYTIVTPVQDENATTIIVAYSSSENEQETEYEFGKKIEATQNITLRPVMADVFTDYDDSGDKVEIRVNAVGLGAATLIKDGKRYKGFVNKTSDTYIEFEVNVRENDQDNGVTFFGKLLNDNKFIYRNEDEAGTYVWYDYLSDDLYMSVMLALDGYDMGVLAFYSNDGTGRIENYKVLYGATKDGDYFMMYYLPAEPDNIYEDYFQIVREPSEDYPELAGYFMFNGYEYGEYMLIYNWEVQEQGLFLDGYGNATIFELDSNGEIYDDSLIEGIYYASADYTDNEPEYVFVANDNSENSFLFTVLILPNGDNYIYLFLIKRGEEGVYTQEQDVEYPELYLDGYGGALYKSEENDAGRFGYYAIESDGNGGYSVLIEFADEAGGKMRVTLDKENNLFINNTVGDFVIVDGVLTEYLGESSIVVIPEGVTEIADGVFKNINITTLTLPSTIEKIGVYAFQNSASATEHSLLTTIYINATTPPVLASDPNSEVGPNPFRWLQDNAKIIVPDDCEDAYREAESWALYVKYITTRAILANKPEFEIDDNGVLLSYNNKSEDPANVEIIIPDNVTAIADSVFASLEYIVSVNLNNVTVIGNKAFYGCINLAAVTFNANTVSIGDEAFYQCAALTELDLGNVHTIGVSAFNRCCNLTVVKIGNAIESIGSRAFAECGLVLDENGDVATDENGFALPPNDLIVTITATVAPNMSTNVFYGSQPRIYVNSYEDGLTFARNATWALYAKSLRVKSDTTQTMYSMENMGAILVLGDNAFYDNGGYVGLYKRDGTKLHIAWFERSGYEDTITLTIIEQVGTFDEANGLYRGFSYEQQPLVFVTEGTQITYVRNQETLTVTFGDNKALFNGEEVTLEIGNKITQFTVGDYIYKINLTISKDFSYTKTRISYVKSYTAADGSAITVTFYEYSTLHKVVGTLKDVNGKECYSETGWYIVAKNEDDPTAWRVMILNDAYIVTAVFNDDDGTFTYSVTAQEA